jgi:hypothetical protein
MGESFIEQLASMGMLLLIAAYVVFVAVRALRQAWAAPGLARQREAFAKSKGWSYDGKRVGDVVYRFYGTTAQGHAWQLHYDSDAGSSSSVPMVHWAVQALASPRIEFEISDGKRFARHNSTLGRAMGRGADWLSQKLGNHEATYVQFADQAVAQPVGSQALRDQWTLLARSPAQLIALIDATTQSLLLGWPTAQQVSFKPVDDVLITQDSKGQRIAMRYDACDLPLFEHVVKLGCALAQRFSKNIAAPAHLSALA